MKRKITWSVLIIVLLFSIIYIAIKYIDSNKQPHAQKGRMDLSQWNFEKDGSVSLHGEWEYYEGQLLTPKDFAASKGQTPELTGYANLTSSRKLFKDNDFPDAKGIRTYRLLISVNSLEQFLGLKVDNVKMSNTLYVNGKLQAKSGITASKENGYKAKNAAYSTFFTVWEEEVEILLQMANYDYPFKGYMYTLVLGSQKDISLSNTLQSALELCFFIVSLFFTLFYFFLYKIGNKEKTMFPAVIQFLSIAVVLLFSGVKLIYFFIPNFPFELFCKVQMLGLTAIAYSVICYTNISSESVFSDSKVKRAMILYGAYSLFVLVTPYRIYSYLNPVILSSYIGVYIYILYELGKIFTDSSRSPMVRRYVSLYFICLGTLAITLGNNFLFVLNVASDRTIGSVSFAIFSLLSQFFVAYRFVINHNNMIQMGRVKDEFITKTSYALKAPLGSIVNTTDSLMLKDDDWRGLSKEDIQKASAIKNIALSLLDIVNATLDVTLLKNDQLKLAVTGVDIRVCTELVVERCEDLIRNRKTQIISEIPQELMVEADESRVRQILWNLIHNSIQSMEEGKIIIGGKQTGSKVLIWVEDTGCGIPEDRKEHIFEPYTALRSHGIGLGLYLSRQLAEVMGGTIYLEWSTVNKGSRFVLSLPAYTGKRKAYREEYETRRQILKYVNNDLSNYSEKEEYKHTILIIDDEIFNIQTAAYILNKEGYRVLTAFSGEEAIRRVKDNKIDVVILDVLMPGKSGITICKKIREKYSLIELPVLISTVGNRNDDLVLALKAGANDFISKPFEEKEVISRVRTLIALKSSIEDAVKSEFAFLQAQIKPHFLYNAINTMVSLCYVDGEKAAKLLTNFSKYLRLIFDTEYKSMTTPLRREIEIIKAYVEIEKARFGEIVHVEYDVAPELLNIEIPPLCIQPLVENSIKHGLCKKRGGGTVYVSVKEEGENIVIRVKDTGVGMSGAKVELLKDMESKSDGIGFFNVSKRVRGWNHAHLDIISEEDIGTIVTITAQIKQ